MPFLSSYGKKLEARTVDNVYLSVIFGASYIEWGQSAIQIRDFVTLIAVCVHLIFLEISLVMSRSMSYPLSH